MGHTKKRLRRLRSEFGLAAGGFSPPLRKCQRGCALRSSNCRRQAVQTPSHLGQLRKISFAGKRVPFFENLNRERACKTRSLNMSDKNKCPVRQALAVRA